MGGSASKQTPAKNAPQLRKQENDIVNLMFPVYYTDEELTDVELDLASKAWKMILTCTAPEFAARKAADPANFDFNHSMVYFYSKFYERLFEVHPLARPLFKDMSSQGKFLVKMLSLALSEKADPDKYRNTLVKLAEIHNDRGIKAVEYGIVGEVLFWSIRACVGVDVYTPELHVAWTKVYSRMLKIMVPIAVAYELKDGKAQEKRFFAHNNNFGMSAEEEMVMNTMAQQADNNQSVTVKKAGTFVAPTTSTSMHQPDTSRGDFTPHTFRRCGLQRSSMMKKKESSVRLKGFSSVMKTDTGWFPSGPFHDRTREVLMKMHEQPELIPSTRKSYSTPLATDSWRNGTLLSELIAGILVDEKSLIKQVEQYDDFGRLSGSPKLVLNGTQTTIKSKAQAVHNMRLCLQALAQIHNFPHIPFGADELVENTDVLQKVVTCICDVYMLPRIFVGDSNAAVIPMVKLTYKRGLGRRILPPYPPLHRVQRAHSAPPTLRRASADPISGAYKREQSRGHGGGRSLSPARKGKGTEEKRGGGFVSPLKSPVLVRRGASLSDNYLSSDDEAKRTVRGRARERPEKSSASTPSSPTYVSLATHIAPPPAPPRASPLPQGGAERVRRVRGREGMRERLAVQRKEREKRAQSIFAGKLKTQWGGEKAVEEEKSGGIKEEKDGGYSSLHTLPRRPPPATATAMNSSSSSVNMHRKSPAAAPHPLRLPAEHMWYPPYPTPAELAEARAYPLPPTPSPLMVRIREWLWSLGIGVREGEGGYYVATFDEEGAVRGGGNLLIPPPLPLMKDRLRNGELWGELFEKLEGVNVGRGGGGETHVAQQLPPLSLYLHLPPNSLPQCKENVERVLWLLRLRRCPPLSSHLLLRGEDIVRGEAGVIWNLLKEIRELYHGVAPIPLVPPHAHPFPYPHMQAYPQPTLGTLSYSPPQRRALDRSLCAWLASLMRDGKITPLPPLYPLVYPLPEAQDSKSFLPTILSLEGYLRDGGMVSQILERGLGISDSEMDSHNSIATSALPSAPTTHALRLKTWRRIIEALRRQTGGGRGKSRGGFRAGFPRRFLYEGVEGECVRGGWDPLLGLLEDMMYMYDVHRGKVPPPPPPDYLSPTYPYVGEWGAEKDIRHEIRQEAKPVFQPKLDLRYLVGESEAAGIFDPTPAIAMNEAVLRPPTPSAPPTLPKDIQPRPRAIAPSAVVSTTAPTPPLRYSAAHMTGVENVATEPSPEADVDEDSLQEEEGERLRKALALSDSENELARSSQPTATAAQASSSSLSQQHSLRRLLAWLERLGVKIPSSPSADSNESKGEEKFFTPSNIASFFSDGVMLGKVVSRVERGSLPPGYNPNPTSSAQRHNNVRCLLDFLTQRNKKIPLSVVTLADGVARGEESEVLKMLECLKKAYKHPIA